MPTVVPVSNRTHHPLVLTPLAVASVCGADSAPFLHRRTSIGDLARVRIFRGAMPTAWGRLSPGIPFFVTSVTGSHNESKIIKTMNKKSFLLGALLAAAFLVIPAPSVLADTLTPPRLLAKGEWSDWKVAKTVDKVEFSFRVKLQDDGKYAVEWRVKNNGTKSVRFVIGAATYVFHDKNSTKRPSWYRNLDAGEEMVSNADEDIAKKISEIQVDFEVK